MLTRTPWVGTLSLVAGLLLGACFDIDHPSTWYCNDAFTGCPTGSYCNGSECVQGARPDGKPPGPDAKLDQGKITDIPRPDSRVVDLPRPDSKLCGGPSGCDDKLTCTTDSCSDAGTCVYKVKVGFCAIGNACHKSGVINITSACQLCNPSKSATAWSNRDGFKCNDKQACTHTDTCKGGVCKGTSYTCDDKLGCTIDSCKGTAPSPAGCSFKLKNSHCLINGKCYKAGGVNPVEPCQRCTPPKGTSTWTFNPCVSTLAGQGSKGYANGPAKSAKFSNLKGIVVAKSGELYVADSDNHCIRKISGGMVSTHAGTCIKGFQDGKFNVAQFKWPRDLAFNSKGLLHVADSGNYIIRTISNKGMVATVAGKPEKIGKANGVALSATFGYMTGIEFGPGDVLYITDSDAHRVRKLSGGSVTTVAGSSKDFANGAALSTAKFNYPIKMAVTSTGIIYLTDKDAFFRIRKIASGQVSTYAGSKAGFSDGSLTTAAFSSPVGLAHDNTQGILYVADSKNNRIRKIQSGQVSTVAGSSYSYQDGSLSLAKFQDPRALALDSTGTIIYVLEQYRIRRIRLK